MKAPVSMRIWFALIAAMLFAGIYLTGFSKVHWLLYVPVAALTIASIIGICPSQIAVSRLFSSKQNK